MRGIASKTITFQYTDRSQLKEAKSKDSESASDDSHIVDYLMSKPEELGAILESYLLRHDDTSLNRPSPQSIAVTKDLFEFIFEVRKSHPNFEAQRLLSATRMISQYTKSA